MGRCEASNATNSTKRPEMLLFCSSGEKIHYRRPVVPTNSYNVTMLYDGI